MNIKYILIIFVVGICLISPLYASDNTTDVLESPQQGNVINITNDNYNDYFEKYTGSIREEADICSGDTLQIGNVTNKVFVIDRQLEITTMSNNDIIKNGYVKLINGSSGCVIHGLKIINDKLNFNTEGIISSNLHGIGLFYTDNNTLYDNYVELAYGFKVFALPMGSSSNNKIYNNTFISTLSTCVPMSECDNNVFYNNYLQTTQANIIYYNPWSHADYSGTGKCFNNSFVGNVLNAINKESEWIIAFAGMYNATIINNTVTNVYTGVETSFGTIIDKNKFINNTNAAIIANAPINITNNVFENVNVAIAITRDNSVVCNNTITNATIGIWSMGKNTNIYNNNFDIIDSYYAITLENDNGRISNNRITVKNYGEAIRLLGKNTIISGNYIKTAVDSAVYVLSSNNIIRNNLISSDLYGVYIDAESDIRYYNRDCIDALTLKPFNQGKINNNVISNNVIDTSSYNVNLRGAVYNTTVTNNNLTTAEATGILIDILDPFSNIISDNIVNGQFVNYTGIVLNDDTFNSYFNENGTFKFDDTDKSILLVVTYLTDKEMVIDRKMDIMGVANANLLKNVCISLLNGSNGTTIHDLTFRNNNKSMIAIRDSDNIRVYNIDFYLKSNSDDLLYAFNLNSTNNITISDNNIYLGGKIQAIEGVNVNNSLTLLLNNNTLILESDKSINALIFNNLNSSNITYNSIQLYGNGEFNALEMNGVHDLKFMGNNILASSLSNITNLCLSNSSNITLNNNYFDIKSNLTQNIIYNSSNILFEFNKIKCISTGGIGNYTFNIGSSDDISIKNNEIYSNALDTLNTMENVEINTNKFVIYDENINSFFNNDNELKSTFINGKDTFYFDNLMLNHYDLIFDNAINITSYTVLSVIDATLIFNSQASYSNITGLNFNLVNNSAIIVNAASNLNIKNNNFNILNNGSENLSAVKMAGKSLNNNISDNEFFMNGNGELTGVVIYNYYDDYYGLSPENNQITNNAFYITSDDTAIAVYNSMGDKTAITANEININAKNAYAIYNDYLPEYKVFMSTIITSNTLISENIIKGTGENVVLIYSKGLKTTIDSNTFTTSSNASYAYVGNKTTGDVIKYNMVLINGSGIDNSFVGHVKQAPIYFTDDSSDALILENHIVSTYDPGDDYAIYIENGTSGMVIKDNYLISDNYRRYSNDAIYAPSALLDNSDMYFVYVSVNGSDECNGSLSNPFKTVKHALENVINGGTVYVLNGVYNESNITISKTITLNALGDVCINSANASLFTVTPSGVFTVNNITFMNANGYSGSTFYNNGKLTLNNISIINSTASTYGGGIYNNGDLTVINSTFSSNKAKFGGVISNNKNANIIDSRFINNGHSMNMSGAAIYNSNKGTLNINGCEFSNNKVDSNYVSSEYALKDEYGVYYSSGGVIYNRGNMNVNASQFDSNYAYRSGGVIISISPIGNRKHNLEISNSNFTNNFAVWGLGGAIDIENANFKISNSTFISNSVSFNEAGAMSIISSSGVIYNSTFSKNSAFGAGALHISKSDVDIILSNISDNSAMFAAALQIYSTRNGNHVVEKINIYNSTISNNKAFHFGVISTEDINLNIKNSNIYDNFAAQGGVLHFSYNNQDPVGSIDVNHNWWGSENGPDSSVWTYAQYFREWDRNMNTWTVISPDEPVSPVQPSDNTGGGQRPANADRAINGKSSTDSNLISNGGGNGGSGSGNGLGYGTGFGSGYGSGFGNAFGQDSGTSTGISTGDGEGNRGSGRGYAGNYTANGEGTLGNQGSASTSGAGGSSAGSQSSSEGGKAYDITKDIIDNVKENSVYLSVLLIIIVLILLMIGYKRRSDKEDEL